MPKAIPLTKGKFAIVDDDDYQRLSEFTWCYWGKYAATTARNKRGGRRTPMHEMIIDVPDGLQPDHINRDRLDNRKCNLRIATRSQNQANRNCRSKTSGFKGVTPDRGKWKAHVERAGRHYNLGRYETLELAARAADAGAVREFGEFAVLNFPNRTPDQSDIICIPRMDALLKKKKCPFCGLDFTVAGLGMHMTSHKKRG